MRCHLPHGGRGTWAVVRLGWAAGLVLLACACGCGKHGKAAPVGGTEVPPSQTKLKRNVELAAAQQQALTYAVETVGYLEAEAQTDIAAGVNGVVDEVLFREGQWVDPSTVLIRVDQRRYVAAAEVTRANEKRAEATVNLAKDLAERARQGRSGVSEEERAKATLGLRVAEAELASAKAARALAEHNLDRSQVRAPYAGQINLRRITPGTFVEDKTSIGTIADLRRLRLVGWVPEKAAPTLREVLGQDERVRSARLLGGCLASASPWAALPGLASDSVRDPSAGFALEFTLTAYPKRTFPARVFYLSTVASADTHMFECKAEVDARQQDVELKPGFSARIRVPLHGNPSACVVPEESVRASERGFIAFVPEQRAGRDGKEEWVARAREVKLGFRAPGSVEVLQGVAPGEWLVRRGAESLEDGTPISIPDAQLQQLQARVTPLRCRGGSLTRDRHGVAYQVQRYVVGGADMLYLMTFCLPRFLDQDFDDKLVTLFHELFHISPAFDGDLRRHPGRCALHSRSKRRYDAHMAQLAREYLASRPDPGLHAFLRLNFAQLEQRHGSVVGVFVPRPKLIPVAAANY